MSNISDDSLTNFNKIKVLTLIFKNTKITNENLVYKFCSHDKLLLSTSQMPAACLDTVLSLCWKWQISQVLARLKTAYGDLYTEQNVMLSGSHTHSTPGGYMQNLLFDLSILGFVRQTFAVLTSGIVKVSCILQDASVRTTDFVSDLPFLPVNPRQTTHHKFRK